MQPIAPTPTCETTNFLFCKRLDFLDTQEIIVSRINDYEPSEDLYCVQNRAGPGAFAQPIRSEEDVAKAYQALNYLVHRCRFTEWSYQQAYQSSKEYLKKNKRITDVENQYKGKVKKAFAVISPDQPQEQVKRWRRVLTHKNISTHLIKAQVFLKAVLENHFQSVKEGKAQIRKTEAPLNIQVKICILVMDVISLISTIKMIFCPYLKEEGALNKLAELQIQFMEHALKTAEKECQQRSKGRNSMLKMSDLNGLKTTDFLKTITVLINKLDTDRNLYRLWLGIQKVRQKYLVQQSGEPRKNIEPNKNLPKDNNYFITMMKEISGQWRNLYKQNPEIIKRLEENKDLFRETFMEYSNFINRSIREMTRKQNQKEFIGEFISAYLHLVGNILMGFNSVYASDFFLDEVINFYDKKYFPATFLNGFKDRIGQILLKKATEIRREQKKERLIKLKETNYHLSLDLLNLNEDIRSLSIDYFDKNYTEIYTTIASYHQTAEKVKQIQERLKNWGSISCEDIPLALRRILELIDASQESGGVDFPQRDVRQTMYCFYTAYPNQQMLLDELVHFLTVRNCLADLQIGKEELQKTKQFYQRKRSRILSDQNINKGKQKKLGESQIKDLPFGFWEFIKIMTYEWILNLRLNDKGLDADKIQNIVYEILKKVQQNIKHKEVMNEEVQEQNDFIIGNMMMKRMSSVEVHLNNYRPNQPVFQDQQVQSYILNNIATNFLKRTSQLRVQMIERNFSNLQCKKNTFKKQFIQLKNMIYRSACKNQHDAKLNEEVSLMAETEHLFLEKNFYEGWQALNEFTRLKQIQEILEISWSGKRNILKLYTTVFQNYGQPIFQGEIQEKDIQEPQIQRLIEDSLAKEHDIKTNENVQDLRKDLHKAIRILDKTEKVNFLRQKIRANKEINNVQAVNQYDKKTQKLHYKQLEKRLTIIQVLGKKKQLIRRKYTLVVNPDDFQKVNQQFKQIKNLNLNPMRIITNHVDRIEMTVEQVQMQFQSYPQLIKHLIETYLKIINFCSKKLQFPVYPLITKDDFQIQQKKKASSTYHRNLDSQTYSLKMNPYEGIILNVLLSFNQLKRTGYFKYPQYPFIYFANQLSQKMQENKTYLPLITGTSQQNGFWHLIREIKAISMEVQQTKQRHYQTVRRILRCPYFWSKSDKVFEIVEFKEKYHSMVGMEQSRRKTNLKIKMRLTPQKQLQFGPQSEQYKKSFGYHKTAQMYLAIEGIMEMQAFLEDIGNFRTKNPNAEFRLQNYEWATQNSAAKIKIIKLIDLIAERQRKKGSATSNVYKRTFPSFHHHIRNLRNIIVHYIYDDTDQNNKRQILLQEKLQLFEQSFPKLFVFIYRWRPFLGKDFSVIKEYKVNYLLNLFSKGKENVIKNLEGIKELQKYKKIRKTNQRPQRLKQELGYQIVKEDGCKDCKPCGILWTILNKRTSLWDLLSDSDDNRPEKKKSQENKPYNYLFYEHNGIGCNGMKKLLPMYVNIKSRSNFTAQECAQITDPITFLTVRKQKLEKKLRRLTNQRSAMTEDNQQSSQRTSVDQDEEQDRQNQPVQRRCAKMTYSERNKCYEEMAKYDYVCKYFLYELELRFPYLFDDLRKERHQWDEKAVSFGKLQ